IADSGTYTVSIEPQQVADTSGQFVIEGSIGTFGVHFPLVVTTTADSGPGSLRQAVIDAYGLPGPDTITFDTAVFATAQSISLTSGELTITDGLTINGPGAALLTVANAAPQSTISRVFYVNSPAAVTLSGMTVTGGNLSSGDGAGIRNGI